MRLFVVDNDNYLYYVEDFKSGGDINSVTNAIELLSYDVIKFQADLNDEYLFIFAFDSSNLNYILSARKIINNQSSQLK